MKDDRSPGSKSGAPVEGVKVRAFTVPTETPESDGTFDWTATTLVVTQVKAGGKTGLGYTYATRAAGCVIQDVLTPVVIGRDALCTSDLWRSQLRAIRNLGPAGLASMAVSAVDTALWDLKARILDIPLVTLLGANRHEICVYGSGGFTNFSLRQLEQHCDWWMRNGARKIKIKIGAKPDEDIKRAKAARQIIGDECELFVDANGAYTVDQAARASHALKNEAAVSWFEEPVSSENLKGLKHVRDRGAVGNVVAAGEYGHSTGYFKLMLDADAVDVLQADATRCGGISGFLATAALCDAADMPLSAHCAPALHLHPACVSPAVRHIEGFFDHVRLEAVAFDGAAKIVDGKMSVDMSRPGHGLLLREQDLAPYEV